MGEDIWLTTLLFLVVADFCANIIRRKYFSAKEEVFRFRDVLQSIGKKALIFIVVIWGDVFDKILSPDSTYIRNTVAIYYIAYLSLKLFDNIGACGIPLPKFLFNIINFLINDKKGNNSTDRSTDSSNDTDKNE